VGQKILLHLASNGVRRCLTAEVARSYEGLTGKPLDHIFMVEGRRSNHHWQPCSASKSTGLALAT